MSAVAGAMTGGYGRLRRSRWAAIGAAVAVALGGGGIFAVQAASSVASSVVTIDPVRILDTRDPVNIGLPGPFLSTVSQKLQVTGGAVPAGATGVLLNVTVVGPTANGFLAVRPGDATGAPSTSSLNFNAGDLIPNSVQVGLPTSGANAGQIDITYDAYGQAGPSTEVLIDVVGYMISGGGAPGPTGPQGPAGTNGSPDTAAQVLSKLVTVDGPGSLLDADTLDGINSTGFVRGTRYHFSGVSGSIYRALPSFGSLGIWCSSGAATMSFQNLSGGNATLFQERASTSQIQSSIIANLAAPVIFINGSYPVTDHFTVRVATPSRSVTWDAWVTADGSACTFELSEVDQS